MNNFFSRKGFVPNLTSRMDNTTRNRWKTKYINVKKGAVVLTLGTATLIDVKALAIDLLTSKLKRYGYKMVFVGLAGPFVQFIALPIYIISGARKIKLLALYLSDIGSKITAAEINMMNLMWYGSDLILFGEPVPIVNSTDLMIFRNESTIMDEFLETVE